MKDTHSLRDLRSVGPAMLRDFERLGVRSVAQLARAKPEKLYEKLCRATGQRQDICCLDVFSAAVAQARNPRLPAPQRDWWYWSRLRKAGDRNRETKARRSVPLESRNSKSGAIGPGCGT